MRRDSNLSPLKLFSLYKHNPLFAKLVVLFLLLGYSFYLFSSLSFDYNGTFSLPSTDLPREEAKPKCDLFKGDWVPDPSGGPIYNNNSCNFIEDHQNCLRNGRPDTGYMYWRWSPRDCELPKFNPERFLDLMRNKSWAFIGDSISRNHVHSFICTLSQVELAKEIYHDEQYKSKTWRFPSYNFTVAVIWAPFLIKSDVSEDDNGFSTSEIKLHLDKLDENWTSQFKGFDYAIIASANWFQLKTPMYYENDTMQGSRYYPLGRNLTKLRFDHAYRKALKLVFDFLTSSSHKTRVFFRTTTPDHFENGERLNGGTCSRRGPYKEGYKNLPDVDIILHEVELEEFENVVRSKPKNGVVLKLLDTTGLSFSRPDGHPGPYRQFQPFAKDKIAKVQNDCLHWCLPGPIDSWNDLVMQMLINS